MDNQVKNEINPIIFNFVLIEKKFYILLIFVLIARKPFVTPAMDIRLISFENKVEILDGYRKFCCTRSECCYFSGKLHQLFYKDLHAESEPDLLFYQNLVRQEPENACTRFLATLIGIFITLYVEILNQIF